ncbi:putative B3 domain-containing protein Os03g0621600 [Gastrolobium bilobum]|uniref:putative B3 domain-containing protein Os03g0621600 n=1 Tax=Gastrolobium bilobum TaxID=150636 RepID=UPI002AB30678|nr:putative B3 domain-containing protein Os03g0621600 [Gastrolobium bilobum]
MEVVDKLKLANMKGEEDIRMVDREMKMLPIKFVRKYGESLPNSILLKLSSSAEWTVNLEKHDGRVWLQNGWKEFVEYHNLAYGHLLVFRYEGTSHFHVFIFDPSTMEIDYPLLDPKRACNGEHKPSKKRRTNENSNKYDSYSNLQDISFHSTSQRRERHGLLKNLSEMSSNTSFAVEIKPRHLRKYIALPKGSLKGYVKPGGQNVTLLVGNRSWKVNLIYYPKKPMTCFSARWLIFSRENDLKVGDVCLFELLECSDDDLLKGNDEKFDDTFAKGIVSFLKCYLSIGGCLSTWLKEIEL